MLSILDHLWSWCLSLWFLGFAVISIAFYWYFTNTFSYWQNKGVFFLKPVIIFGNIKSRVFFQQSFHEFQLELYNRFEGHRYGGFFEGRRPTLAIRDPELIKCVMVRDFDHFVDRPTLNTQQKPHIQNMLIFIKGAHWKAVRALMTPTFSSGKMRVMEEMVCDCAEQMSKYLTEHTNKKDTSNELELKEYFGRFTLEVIASCAFGVQSDSLKDPEAKFVKIAARFNDLTLPQRLLIFFVILFVPKLARFFPLAFFNHDAMSFLTSLLKETKKGRECNASESQGRKDFLQLMVDAANKESGNDVTSKVLDEDTIIAQSLLFLIAGFETSSTLLTFASYELALNPDIQEKLRKEVQATLSKHNNKCTYETLQEMPYLEMVMLETLRKHPPVARVDRVCTDAYTLPGTTLVVEKDTVVAIPVIGLHYDPKFYPEPHRFDPERFSTEEKSQRSPYVYLPFGSGPRNCIGMRFAMMSTKIAMVYLLKDFEIKPSAKTQVPYKYSRFSMLLKAQDGIWLNIEKL